MGMFFFNFLERNEKEAIMLTTHAFFAQGLNNSCIVGIYNRRRSEPCDFNVRSKVIWIICVTWTINIYTKTLNVVSLKGSPFNIKVHYLNTNTSTNIYIVICMFHCILCFIFIHILYIYIIYYIFSKTSQPESLEKLSEIWAIFWLNKCVIKCLKLTRKPSLRLKLWTPTHAVNHIFQHWFLRVLVVHAKEGNEPFFLTNIAVWGVQWKASITTLRG